MFQTQKIWASFRIPFWVFFSVPGIPPQIADKAKKNTKATKAVPLILATWYRDAKISAQRLNRKSKWLLAMLCHVKVR